MATIAKPEMESQEKIRVLPVQRTPESNSIALSISMPQNGELKAKNPVWVQFRLDGYPLGAGSPSDRVREVALSKAGQTVHVIIDNHPYFEVNEPSVDPFNEDGYYYDTSYKFEIPYKLGEGMHTIRMFPARSYGEGLKNEGTFQSVYFYVGSKTGKPEVDFSGPYLTYNEPGEGISLKEAQPVLLDFYIKNCELSSDGYKILLTLDGNTKRTLTHWQPYYIYGLTKGKHQIRLQLVDSSGQVVGGSFNDIQRTIQVK